MSIEVRNITKDFGGFVALKDVSLRISTGELTALLGPSGSGKTTLLRIMAGLEVPDCGTILFHNEDVTSRNVRDRRVGFVFQHYALFRHMTVFENIAFGLRVRPRDIRSSEKEIHAKVFELLKLVQLDWLAKQYPSQLSGGQRQRIALARALAVEPKLLLLDEPFGALDAKIRQELRRWLRRLHDELNVTSVFVTHDQEEALEVADRVVVMNEGSIEQVGTPDQVYRHPVNPFVYDFLGATNFFHGRIHHGRAKIGAIELDAPEHANIHDCPAIGYVRPHDIEIERTLAGDGAIEAVVHRVYFVGPLVRIELVREDNSELVDAEMSAERYDMLNLREGEHAFLKPRNLRLFLKGS